MPTTLRIYSILPDEKKYPTGRLDKFERESLILLNTVIGPRIARAFQARVANWRTPVLFKQTLTKPSGTFGQVTIMPGKGKSLWSWISFGVRSRQIFPNKAASLLIRGGHSPRTTPGNRYGGSGRYAGPFTRTSGPVNWPGIRPRLFEEHVIEEQEGIIQRDVDRMAQKVFR